MSLDLETSQHRHARHAVWLILPIVVFLIVVLGRVAAPSDLWQNDDQAKTIAYTTDIVLHDRWIIPRSNVGELTTKPVLVNWIGAICVWLLGYAEWIFKMPSILAGALLVIATMLGAFQARRHFTDQTRWQANPWLFASLAGVALASSPFFTKHVYFLRPDMLNAGLLALGWIAATLAMDPKTRHPMRWAILLWICFGLAALTKGFTAFLLPAYVVLASKICFGKFLAIHRTGWYWGLPLGLILGLSWPALVWQQNADHLWNELLGDQVGKRFDAQEDSSGLVGYVTALVKDQKSYELFGWPFEATGAWSLMVILALACVRPIRGWVRSPMGPALVWCCLILTVFLLQLEKGPSYLLPMYGPWVVIAMVGWAHCPGRWQTVGRTVTVCVLACVMMSISLGHEFTGSRGAKDQAGEIMIDFANQANAIVGDDPVRYKRLRNAELPNLMGRHGTNKPKQPAYKIILQHEDKPIPDNALIVSESTSTRRTQHLKGPGRLILIQLVTETDQSPEN